MNERRETGATQTAPESTANGSRRIYQKKRFVIPVAFLFFCAALIFLYWYFNLRGFISTDDSYVDGDPVTVSSKVLGRITQLAVDEGDTLSQGELIAQLDDSDLRAQEAQAAASLEYARQNVPLARINMQRAQDDFDRAATQFKDNVIPKEQYDHAKKTLEMANAQYKVAQAQVNTAQAQLNVIQTQLGNMRITAPMAGEVAKKWVVVGDIVQPGQPIVTVYNLHDIWVTANFEETNLSAIRIGDLVEISVDAYRDRKFEGKVILIGAAAASQFSLIPPNNASGNFTKVTQRVPIRISIVDSRQGDSLDGPLLLPGMSVEVKVRVKSE